MTTIASRFNSVNDHSRSSLKPYMTSQYPSRNGHPPRHVATSSITTPLAAPPPPLRLAEPRDTHNPRPAYAGALHTLGPQFSEEEDGDDSEYIASKMADLGLNQNREAYPSPASSSRFGNSNAGVNVHQYQQEQLRLEQEVLALQELVARQPQAAMSPQVLQMKEALALRIQQHRQQTANAQLQAYLTVQAQAQTALAAARAQAQFQAQVQPGHVDPRLQLLQQHQMQQMQLASFHQMQQQQYASASDQRAAAAAQVQANLAARTRARSMKLDDQDLRARFESAPNVNQGTGLRSPFAQHGFDNPLPLPKPPSPNAGTSTKGPHYHSVSADNNATPGSLSVLLSRRSQQATYESSSRDSDSSTLDQRRTNNTTAQTSPSSSIGEHDKPNATPLAREELQALGHGRPSTSAAQPRAWSTPAPTSTKANVTNTPRAASYAGRSLAIRQPLGPPGNIEKLREENFKSLIRKRAGQGLGMLGRRTDSPSA